MYNFYRSHRYRPEVGRYRRGFFRPYFTSSLWNWPSMFYVNDDDTEEETPTTPATRASPVQPTETPEDKPVQPEPPNNFTEITNYKLIYLNKQNSSEHRTNKYGGSLVVLRRGQEFRFKIELNSFDEGKDKLKIQFLNGPNPQASKGTLIDIPVCKNKEEAMKSWVYKKEGWYGYFEKIGETELEIVLMASAQAPIGKYRVRSQIVDQQRTGKYQTIIRDGPAPIYLIFNPWCKDDQVYMEDEREKYEYVMNEDGRIWYGSYTKPRSRPWNFGQFSRTSLKVAMYLLEKSELALQKYGNATIVCRTLTRMANNCNSNDGILVGNWSGDYTGGTKPTEWTGSGSILEEYMGYVEKDKEVKHVNFGQCWVFSGLLTTLSRTLGIPARSVTNYASAHDQDNSLSIDKHFDEDGEPVKYMDDSVWNFHVWNEAWLARPDLPAGYDGWQAYDSTPQELSAGQYQCGPAPVKAIREGIVHMNYDIPFIFSEVNGDRVTWIVSKDQSIKPGKHVTNSVGKKISTKAVAGLLREDVTNYYKYEEGTDEERDAVTRANEFMTRYSEKADLLAEVYNAEERDVKIDCLYDKPPNGDLSAEIKLKNNANEKRTIKIRFTANASYYTGVIGKELGRKTMTVVLQPGEERNDITWGYKAEEYLDEVDEDAVITIHTFAKVVETGQWDGDSESSEIEKPELKMQVSNETPKVGEEFTVTIKMENPINIKLRECRVHLEGAGIQKRMRIEFDDIEPNKEAEQTVTLTAKYPGTRSVIACFNCRQLQDITGMITLEVQE